MRGYRDLDDYSALSTFLRCFSGCAIPHMWLIHQSYKYVWTRRSLAISLWRLFYWWVDIIKALWFPHPPPDKADVVMTFWNAACKISHSQACVSLQAAAATVRYTLICWETKCVCELCVVEWRWDWLNLMEKWWIKQNWMYCKVKWQSLFI